MAVHPEAQTRPLFTIAAEIRRTWKDVNFGAVPYLEAMAELDLITDSYYSDSAHTVVCTFLSNTRTWKGEDAHRIKNELRAMVGLPLAKAPKPKARPVIDQDAPDRDELLARAAAAKADRKADAALLRAAVSRTMFCPYSNVVLDMRRAVLVITPGRSICVAATEWDKAKDEFFSHITAEQAATVKVYDGRELFTPAGRVR